MIRHPSIRSGFLLVTLLLGLSIPSPSRAVPTTVRVTVRNLAPQNGTFMTPLWVGFHDGLFDLFDFGSPASAALERLAEDGDTAPLAAAFGASGAGFVEGTLSGPLGPGQLSSMLFVLESTLPTSQFFSYAAMVIPSNDAFIANGNPQAVSIFDGTGAFLGADFIVAGSLVNDAGTEVNDEVAANTAFFGQTVPNTGIVENGVVSQHLGFLPPGSGGILDDPMFENADFTAPGYQIARITITRVPEPGALLLLGAGGVVAGVRVVRRGRVG